MNCLSCSLAPSRLKPHPDQPLLIFFHKWDTMQQRRTGYSRDRSRRFKVCVLALVLWCTGNISAESRAERFETFLEPNTTIDLSSIFRDRLEKLHVQEGDIITKGQLLAQLNTTVLQAQLDRAQTAAAFKGEINGAVNLVKMRTNRLKLLEELNQSGNIRPQELTVAQTDLAIARAELQSAREAQQLRQQEAAIVAIQLQEKMVTSPIDGVILKIYTQEAELVGGADTQPLMTIVQLDPLKAVFHLPPEYGLSLTTGTTLPVSSTNQLVTATVTRVAPLINPQSGTVEIELELPNPDASLIAGSLCSLEFTSSTASPLSSPGTPGQKQRTEALQQPSDFLLPQVQSK